MQTAQMNLFDKTIAARFEKFHTEHPRVYMLFRIFALQLLQRGHKKIGAKMIMERVRWECATGGKDDRGYKINNDFIAHYARLFVHEHPQYQDCFEMRMLKAA
jgi:hypothetical protein